MEIVEAVQNIAGVSQKLQSFYVFSSGNGEIVLS